MTRPTDLASGWFSLGLAAALVCLGTLAALDLQREVRASDLRAVGGDLDARVERAVADPELYRALRDATPPDVRVFFVGDAADVGTQLAFAETEPLVFPRRFFRVYGIPAGWEPPRLEGVPVAVVTYGALRDTDLSAWFDQAAEGARFRVWLLRGEDG